MGFYEENRFIKMEERYWSNGVIMFGDAQKTTQAETQAAAQGPCGAQPDIGGALPPIQGEARTGSAAAPALGGTLLQSGAPVG